MTERPAIQERDSPSGLAYAISAYILWGGVIPAYWHLLDSVPSVEVAFHRVVWCVVCVGILLALRRRFSATLAHLRNRKLVLTLAATGALLTANWAVWIGAVAADRLVEASLGYYITPLISVALGTLALGERLSTPRILAVVLATGAVVVQTIALGQLPWIALWLAASFGLYGYLRKTAKIGALEGVFLETALLAPVAVARLIFVEFTTGGSFLAGRLHIDALLIFSGVVTAVPLTLFSAGARRIRLTTLGFLQCLSPSITLALATIGFGEPFTYVHATSFGCIWLALLLLTLEGVPERIRRRSRELSKVPSRPL
jgi:chloramphenicol-sensitive protein RarD